jgi:DNA-binding PadR family transcriptional regulator
MIELSRREEQVLLAIWNLKEEAYLLAIREHLSQLTNNSWSVGIIHKPLMQLERKGCVTSFMGDATARRGGRRKKIYRITREGIESLKLLKNEHDALWRDFLMMEMP